VKDKDALCLEPPSEVFTNNEKIKDHQVMKDAKVYYHIFHSPGSLNALTPGKVRLAQLYPQDQLTFSFQFCQLYILDARRTLPILFHFSPRIILVVKTT
jgi:hypothetical protein